MARTGAEVEPKDEEQPQEEGRHGVRLSVRRAGQRGIPAERAQAGPVQRPVARVVVVGVVERRGPGRGLVALGEEDAEGVVAAVLVLPRHGDAVRGGLVRHAARHAGARAELVDAKFTGSTPRDSTT